MTRYTHPDLPDFISPAAFTLDGVQYPRVWWRTVSPQEIAGMGFVKYNPPEPEPDPVVVPERVTRYQLITGLAVMEWITKEEALAAITTGGMPAVISEMADQLPEDDRFAIHMKWAGFLHAYREDPLVLTLAQLVEKTPEEIDEFFVMCAGIQ